MQAVRPLLIWGAGRHGGRFGKLLQARGVYIDAFIARDEGDPLEIQYSNELGFAFDTTPKVKLWFFKLPRIGIGYRWGQNIRGLRLNFGFPF